MPKPNKQYIIGVDIGGTKMDAILFDGEKIIADDTLATPRDNLSHFLIMLNALIKSMEEKARTDRVKIKGIGLGIPGPIDYNEGKILVCNNVHIIDGTKLAGLIEEQLEMPVKMDHDINCMLRAEIMLGSGQKYENAYGVTVSTGIGGAWWHNNKIYSGAHGGAGEAGEMIIDFAADITLEQSYHKLTQNNPAKLAQEAYRGDPLAEQIFSEVGKNLGIALANIANILNPEAFILMGGAMQSGDLFLSQIKKAMRARIHSPLAAKKTKVTKGALGAGAGALGAALLFNPKPAALSRRSIRLNR